ncbi:hypothetical protein ACIGXM_21915 [Kitasatospora sp. NPDC052896]|uniref:hypothetical protein n=1 Tax=Kitasatospora sp. NPDC052896 TaxID=3364061 RepID=UPI0037CB36A3
MRRSTLKRAAALLIGAGALAAATAPGAVAAPAPRLTTKAAPIVRTMPHTNPATRTAKAAPISIQLNPGQSLQSGASMSAGDTTLVMQSDGNLVLYLVANNGTHIQPLWNSGTYGNAGAYGLMQSDGNFVIYKQGGGPSNGGALWNTGTWGKSGALLVLVDGELLVGAPGVADPYWQTTTGFIPTVVNGQYTDQPSDTIASGQGLVPNTWVESSSTILIMQADGNLVLYRKSDGTGIWASWTFGHPGMDAVMDSSGVFAVANSNEVLWNTGTWNNPGAYAKVQSDGNFVVYSQGGGPSNGGALWNTGTWGKA